MIQRQLGVFKVVVRHVLHATRKQMKEKERKSSTPRDGDERTNETTYLHNLNVLIQHAPRRSQIPIQMVRHSKGDPALPRIRLQLQYHLPRILQRVKVPELRLQIRSVVQQVQVLLFIPTSHIP